MNRDDIIRIAWSANLLQVEFSTAIQEMWVSQLERFAHLIAAAEREACAKLCDEMAEEAESEREPSSVVNYYRAKAAAIRARGQQ